MDELLKWLNNNPWLNLIFLVLSIFSIIVSYIIYYRGKRDRKPVFVIESTILFHSGRAKLPGLKVNYLRKPIHNLTLSKIVIWNRGKATVNKSDIAPTDPLRIELNEGLSLLQSKINYVENTANNFTLRIVNNIVYLDFDYFHTNEGVIIEIYHTGLGTRDVNIKGSVKDTGHLKRVNAKDYYTFIFLENTLGRLNLKKRSKYYWPTLLIFAIIATPIFMPLIIADKINQTKSTFPKQFGKHIE